MNKLNYSGIYKFNHTMNATISGDSITIGTSRDNTYQFDINSLNKTITNALNKLNGHHTLKEVLSGLSISDKNEFVEFFQDLINASIVVDATAKCPVPERYDRQINYFYNVTGDINKAMEIQKKIENSKIAIVGIGGVGSFVLYNLVSMGIGYIKAYDFDTVELSNISRQMMYNTDDVGKNKIEVSLNKMQLINPNCDFSFINKKISSLEDAMETFEGVDLVISVADIPRPDFIFTMNEAAFFSKKAIIFGGSSGSEYIVGPLYNPGESLCYKCVNKINDHDQERADRFPFIKNIQSEYMTTLINPFNSIAASFLTIEAIKFLSGYLPYLKSSVILGNVSTREMNVIEEKSKRAHCKLC